MIIKLAKTAGFCFGVDRAVKLVYDLLEKGEKISTLGPIIHNPQVIEDLEKRGVTVINSPDEAEEGRTVVIRAHGVERKVYDELEKRDIKYIDATCPFVTKIHKIVSENAADDKILMIAGDENHPEVIGFRSEAKGESYVFSSVEELEALLEKHSLRPEQLVFVSQTTFSLKEAEKIQKFADKVLKYSQYYDTICSATQKRQDEAECLAKSCDAMVVIGGRFSSNTVKLKSVCEKFCPTFLVEQARELHEIDFSPFSVIGITAGASTPASIIKEGVTYMTNENEIMTNNEGESFASMLENFVPDTNALCDGVVLEVTPTEIQLDIGRKFTAFIPAEEYSWEPAGDFTENVHVGDHIMVKIMRTDENEGTIKVSKRRADSELAFERIKEAYEQGTVLTSTVAEIRNSGVIVYPFGGRVFIPYTQAGLSRGASLSTLEKKEVNFKIISIDDEKKRAVGSIRIITDEIEKEKLNVFLATAEVGKMYTAKVTSVVNYGAFVDLGGAEALLHRSELSWKRINNVSSVLSVGDEIEVKIIKIEEDENGKTRISVSAKREEDLPWPTFMRNCQVGDIVKIKVQDFKTFGAIVRLVDHNLRGLVHIREVANHFVEDIKNELKIGQTLDAKIISIDDERQRINLSIRALLPDEEKISMEEIMAAAAEEEAKKAEEDAKRAEEEAEAAKEAAEVAEALASVAAVETDSAFADLAGEAVEEEAPAEEPAAEEAPAEEAPVEESAAEEAPAEEAPAEEPAAEEAPAEEAPAEEPAAEEAPVEEAPAEESAAEEAPAEEVPADEPAAEEAPAEEAPAEDTTDAE